MNAHPFLAAVIGGALIGLASSAMLLFLGRIAGISGIASELLRKPSPQNYWRYAFIGGMLCGGLLLRVYYPEALATTHPMPYPLLALAGLLVGYGTRLGSGCTSGHGVCGLARRSLRSLCATLMFMTTGILTVYLAHLIRN